MKAAPNIEKQKKRFSARYCVGCAKTAQLLQNTCAAVLRHKLRRLCLQNCLLTSLIYPCALFCALFLALSRQCFFAGLASAYSTRGTARSAVRACTASPKTKGGQQRGRLQYGKIGGASQPEGVQIARRLPQNRKQRARRGKLARERAGGLGGARPNGSRTAPGSRQAGGFSTGFPQVKKRTGQKYPPGLCKCV